MRHIACHNDDCANAYAPYFDFEPAETVVLCPACAKTMTVTTVDQLEQLQAAKQERDAAAAAEPDTMAADAASVPATEEPTDA